MASPFASRLVNRGPLRAELLCAAWETFSALLFASAVLPAVLRSPLAALVFAGTLIGSAFSLRAFVQRGDVGMAAASWLRVPAWLVALVPVPASADGRTWIATAAFGVMAAAMRRAIYRRELSSPPHGGDSEAFSSWFRARLGEGATLAGIVGGHFLLLFSVAFLRAESQMVFKGWWVFLPLLAAGATAFYSLAMRHLTRDVVGVLETGPEGPRDTLLLVARRLYDLPLRLSLTNFGLWVVCTFVGVFYFRPGPASWQSADALLQLVYATLFAWGVAFYQRGWDRDTIAQVQRLLFRWAGAEPGEEEPAAPPRYARFAIRERMLRDFGWPLVFAAVLMLLSSIGLYRTLGERSAEADGEAAVLAQVAAFLMLALAVGAVIARVARELARPIVAVAEAAESVAEGDLGLAMPVVAGPSEVAKLASSVERMRGRLAKMIGELEEERSSLESKVRVRTAELEQAYNELRETQAALVQTERLASIGALVAGVAHEIGNPLNAVAGSAEPLVGLVRDVREVLDAYRAIEERMPPEDRRAMEALRERTDLDESLEDLTGISAVVRRATERAVKIVQNLKHFTHISGESLPTNLHVGLEETLVLLGPRLRQAGVVVERNLGELPAVLCNAGEINQIFMNLGVNALQALEGLPSGESRRISITSTADETDVLISFADSGPGIPPDLQGRIFDPFFTTKPPGQGTGLGLSISGDIARKHGGSLLLGKAEQGGTCFVLRLPQRPAQKTRASLPPAVKGDPCAPDTSNLP